MAGWIKMSLGMEVGLGPDDFVLDGDPASPPQKGGRAPQFSAHVYCGQTAEWIKMPLGTAVGLGPDNIVLDVYPAPLSKRGWSPSPIFGGCLLWRNGWMDQDGTWHMEVGLGPFPSPAQPRRLCVRCGSISPKKAQPPIFGPCLLWRNGCMYQNTTWYVGRPQPSDIVLDGDPAPPRLKRHVPPNFRRMSVVDKWLDGLRCRLIWR